MPFIKSIKSVKTFHWTRHSREKMRVYNLSEARVRRVINSPKRIEEGIAPKTIAMMQPAGSKKHPYEIWVMIQKKKGKAGNKKGDVTKIISAWRYPGITKPGAPLPEEILRELKAIL